MKWLKMIPLLFISLKGFAQPDSLEKRIVLIGDAGALIEGRSLVIDAVRKIVPMTKNTVVLFEGDNLYTVGLPREEVKNYMNARNVLDSQVALVRNTPAKAYFIPGNHDWANGKIGGFESLLRQERYINAISPDNVRFYPEDGCPGPVAVNVSENVVMIIMDSQWWLQRTYKPGIESDCPCKTTDEVLTQIKDIIDNNPRKLILFAAHHPFRSTGPHSGYFGLKQHIFPFSDLNKNLLIPLPLLGSLYPISRSVFGSPQDLHYPLYEIMSSSVEEVLKTHPYVVHLNGHEHSLQLLNDSDYHYIISGAGCKQTRVNKNKKVSYSAQSLGFAVLDILKNKNVNVTFYEVHNNSLDSIKLAHYETLLNFSKFPPLAKDTVTVHDFKFMDSVTASINLKYDKASAFKRFVLGDNYRKEWATPVNFKVFNIRKEMGGFKIEGLGGGHQSKTLHLVDKKGKKWILRSMNKDPEKIIPANYRHSIASKVMQDMVSTQNPYGALVIPPLSDALFVPHATPKYYFVPDDYALGYYRPVFANTVCMLEESEPTIAKENAKSTDKMLNKLLSDNDHTVDGKTLLSARLLDFLVSDFDRHADQWKWGSIDTGKGKVYYPIAKDRDEAFYNSDGLMMKIATIRLLPYLHGFQQKMKKPKWMGYVARDFDRMYLNELDENNWNQGLAEFKASLSDSIINTSVSKLPPPIRSLDSAMIVSNLKRRMDELPSKAMAYYRFISKRVNIVGSNDQEFFHVSNSDSGVLVTVFATQCDTYCFLRYSRHFDPKVTKEIRMFGLNGNDAFKIDDDVSSKIKFTVVGGQGIDTFDMQGRVKNYVYDNKTTPSVFLNRKGTRNMLSDRPEVNDYSIKEFNYDTWRFPQLKLGYNPEDELLVGVGLWARLYGFRKAPYASDQKFYALVSPYNSAYQAEYKGEFINSIHTYDVLVNAHFVNPTINNFFGYGNETERKPGASLYYYRTRYKFIAGDLMLRKRQFNNLLRVSLGPTFYYYWDHYENNADRILAHPDALGLDSASIYSIKLYAGGKLSINVNNVNDPLFPTRGVDWTTELVSMQGLDDNSHPYTKLESNMNVYASLTDPAKVVAILHIGAGRILSDQFEYFQALTLGANNYLRGFQKDRFSGYALLSGSVELRVKLFDINSYVVPGSFGLVGFNDAGRVWMHGETSHRWHDAVGTGIYFTPFNKVLLSATTAFSREETIFNFTMGTKINLTF